MKRIGILNAGAWGTAVGKILAEKGYSVEIWDYMEEVVKDINANHTNSRFLFGVELPENIKASSNILETASNKDFLFFATPSLYILDLTKKILSLPDIIEGKTDIGILTKGFIASNGDPKLILESMERYLPGSYKNNLVYISGPSHAEEVARGKLTGLISASLNGKKSIRFRQLLTSNSLVVFSSLDIIGVQICGAMKNVIAIAFGMLDALMELSSRFGDNTESLLLAAGLNEIQAIGQALGSTHPETFTSIAGVGDLDVTCRSRYGRNRRFGKEIISTRIISRFKNLDDIIENISDIGYLPEGIMACKYAIQIAGKYNLKLPITKSVFRVLNKEIEPFEALNSVLKDLTSL